MQTPCRGVEYPSSAADSPITIHATHSYHTYKVFVIKEQSSAFSLPWVDERDVEPDPSA